MRLFKFILPAAGIASRLSPSVYPKELLPISYSVSGVRARPTLVIDYSIRAMRLAGVTTGAVVISPHKHEILRHLGDGSTFGVSLMYSVQTGPTGLASALDTVTPWLGESAVCLALPDTIFRPHSAIAEVIDLFVADGADLALGVFPTKHPERLGPVEFLPDGQVLQVDDKPTEPRFFNTWGVAVWGARFTSLMHDKISEHITGISSAAWELPLGNVFQAAVQQGLTVRAKYFPDGDFLDLGTPEGLYDAFCADGRYRDLHLHEEA